MPHSLLLCWCCTTAEPSEREWALETMAHTLVSCLSAGADFSSCSSEASRNREGNEMCRGEGVEEGRGSVRARRFYRFSQWKKLLLAAQHESVAIADADAVARVVWRMLCLRLCVCVCSIASSFLASRASLLLYRLPPHHLITILVAVDSVIARAFASKLAVLGSCVQLPPKANAQAVLQLPFTEGATGGQSAARWRQMLLGGIFKIAKGSTKLALVLAACSRLCCRCCHSCQCCCPCGSLPQRLAGCSVTSRVWRARLAHLKVNARLN